MTALEIIAKKRDGEKLDRDEIEFMVLGYTRARIPDYQMAAWLMAVYLNGMDARETAAMTETMLHSGQQLSLSSLPGPKIDKHSTGGVGDKVSLILAPLVACTGVVVPMISGRGLGHSGGTLDKLEAIPGFSTRLSLRQFTSQLREIGVGMMGQTRKVVPADRKIYALRDATSTIASIPLIIASILCKKLAENLDGLVLDIKTGNGAFMSTREESSALAEGLVATAKRNRLETVAVVTDMNQPLGLAVGNWLETHEAIRALQGEGPTDLMRVTLHLGAHMLRLAKKVQKIEQGLDELEGKIANGEAFERFMRMVQMQGGDNRFIRNPHLYPPSDFEICLDAPQSGYLVGIDTQAIGRAVVHLGGGRETVKDTIDPKAGLILDKKIGDRVEKGATLARLFSDRPSIEEIAKQLRSAFSILPKPVTPAPLIGEEFSSV
ncbi:thymidine phosphorylase [candidate division KSB1 bacterium]|nr:thymidine phosphorylase [candidate division KSB1 bacterium]